MEHSAIGRPYPNPPAEISDLYAVLGRADTVRFLLTFGGARLYIAEPPRVSRRVADLVGRDRALALGKVRDRLQLRVPLAKRWLAGVFHAEGASIDTIARTLRTTDVTVQKYLRDCPAAAAGRS